MANDAIRWQTISNTDKRVGINIPATNSTVGNNALNVNGAISVTDPETTRSNLGVGSVLLDKNGFVSGSITLENGMKYSELIFLGRTSNTKINIDGTDKRINTGIVVPTANITTGRIIYEITDSRGEFIFTLHYSGDDVIATYVSSTDTTYGAIVRVYGVI